MTTKERYNIRKNQANETYIENQYPNSIKVQGTRSLLDYIKFVLMKSMSIKNFVVVISQLFKKEHPPPKIL